MTRIDATAIHDATETSAPIGDVKRMKEFIKNQLSLSFNLEELATQRARPARGLEALSPRRLNSIKARARMNYPEASTSLNDGQFREIVNHKCRKAKEKYDKLCKK